MRLTRLPLRVQPAPFEPGWALFNRLALRHGCATGTELVQQLKLRRYGYFIRNIERGHGFAEIAALTAMPLDQILRSSIRCAGTHIILAGEILRRTRRVDIATIYGRVCIECLQVDLETRSGPIPCRPWRRAWWDVAAISTCPIHGSLLLAACPVCHNALDRKVLNPTRCRCGQYLLSVPRTETSHSDTLGDAYVVGRLGGMKRTEHPFLDTMALTDAIDIMHWTGAARLWGKSMPGWRVLQPLQRAQALSAGFCVFQNFPCRFETLLDRMLETHPRRRRSPIGVYGKLQNWLGRSANPAFDPLRQALRRHIERNIPITPGTRVLGQITPGGELTTLGAVASLCGCSEGRIATIAVALSLINPPSGAIRRSSIVPKSIEAPLVAFFRSSCEREEARRRLNVSRMLFKELQYLGLIRKAFSLNGLTIPARYYLTDIDQFLARLHQEAPLKDRIPEGCETITRAV
ncbi:TniQ family protein, partial [Hoeflea sp.]